MAACCVPFAQINQAAPFHVGVGELLSRVRSPSARCFATLESNSVSRNVSFLRPSSAFMFVNVTTMADLVQKRTDHRSHGTPLARRSKFAEASHKHRFGAKIHTAVHVYVSTHRETAKPKEKRHFIKSALLSLLLIDLDGEKVLRSAKMLKAQVVLQHYGSIRWSRSLHLAAEDIDSHKTLTHKCTPSGYDWPQCYWLKWRHGATSDCDLFGRALYVTLQ